MREEKVKNMYHAIEKQPGLIFAVIEEGGEPGIQNLNTDGPSWCRSEHCREIVKLIEKECGKRNPEKCIPLLPKAKSVDYFLYYLEAHHMWDFVLR